VIDQLDEVLLAKAAVAKVLRTGPVRVEGDVLVAEGVGRADSDGAAAGRRMDESAQVWSENAGPVSRWGLVDQEPVQGGPRRPGRPGCRTRGGKPRGRRQRYSPEPLAKLGHVTQHH
jgi:hypothetical protein